MTHNSTEQQNTLHHVPGYQIASIIKLNYDEMRYEEIEVVKHSISYHDLTLSVTFRHVSDLLYHRINVDKMSESEAIEGLVSAARWKLSSLGVPIAAHFDIGHRKRPNDSCTDISCKFFIKPKTYYEMSSEIREGFVPGVFYGRSNKDFILSAALPPRNGKKPATTDDENIDEFALYIRKTMLPWEGRWLLDYSLLVDWKECNEKILIDLEPPDEITFSYDGASVGGCSHLLLFSYEVAPILVI